MNLLDVAREWPQFTPLLSTSSESKQPVQSSDDKPNPCKFCDWFEYPFPSELLVIDRSFSKQHNATEWHRFNVHLKTMHNATLVTYDEFELLRMEYAPNCPYNMSLLDFLLMQDPAMLEHNSLQQEESPTALNVSPKSSFINRNNEVVHIWNVLLNRYEVQSFGASFLASNWLLFLCGGGYFAAGVFQNATGTAVFHRAVHRYTVRKGQGGSQSLKDMSKRCHSAGSSIRRYNEVALVQDILDTLNSWNCTIDFVLFNASVGNKHVLDASKFASVPRASIPFTTYRATWGEIQRCYRRLIECR